MGVSGNTPETMWLSDIKSDYWIPCDKVNRSHLGESMFGLGTCLIHVLISMNPKWDLLFGVKRKQSNSFTYTIKRNSYTTRFAKCKAAPEKNGLVNHFIA